MGFQRFHGGDRRNRSPNALGFDLRGDFCERVDIYVSGPIASRRPRYARNRGLGIVDHNPIFVPGPYLVQSSEKIMGLGIA